MNTVILASLLLGAAGPIAQAAEVCLVKDGKAQAVIVIPNDLPPLPEKMQHPLFIEFGLMQSHDRLSAQILADYIKRATGAELPIVEGEAPAGRAAIHVGATPPAGLDADGFHVTAAAGKITLAGASPQGTEFAVYDFLEHALGIRWLFAGELGEHVPQRSDLCVSEGRRTSQPRYISRTLRIKGDENQAWARRNRMHTRIEFHHNVSKIVPMAWTREHPEFFPLINGARYLPKQVNRDDWHLCYAASGVDEAMANLLVQCFTKYPQYKSISLGVADGGPEAYCRCDGCDVASPPGVANFMGFEERSDAYYAWCNAVLNRVDDTHGDRWFGALAYREVIEPPSFKVHDRLVPYVTWELLQWSDSARREEWKRLMTAWTDKAKHLGHYEYMFGERYFHIPRLYIHATADYLRYAADLGTIGFYAETTGIEAPTMGYHGPQPYILLRLLWDPQADPDALLRDWCEAAVGAGAASHLIAYFRHWERIWTQEVPKTVWYGTRNRMYLKFNSDEYLEGVTREDLDQAGQLLEQTVAAAPQGMQRRRAESFLAEFRKRRAERLNAQVAGWDAQRRLAGATVGAPVHVESFVTSAAGWKRHSENDNQEAVHDASRGLMRFSGDSTLESPPINVEKGGVHAVTWRMASDSAPEGARVTLIMDVGAGPPVMRNLAAADLMGGSRDLRYAVVLQDGAKLRCIVYVRGMRAGEVRLEELTVAPVVN